MNEQQQFNDYFDNLSGMAREQDKARLRSLVLSFHSTLQRLPALKQELDLMLQSAEALDYEALLQRVEPVLQQASDWLLDVDSLPSNLADDAEMKKFTADVCARLALANAARLIPSFYSFQHKVMEDRENAAQERAEAKRRAEKEAKREEAERIAEEKHKAEKKARLDAEREAEELERQQQEADSNYQFNLGMEYLSKNDFKQAEYWLKKAAQQGNDVHQFELGMFYFNEDKFKDAQYWLEKVATKITKAQCKLGLCFYQNADYSNALYWLEKASNAKDSEAQCELGIFYCGTDESSSGYKIDMLIRNPIGKFPLNTSDGIELLRKSAESGYIQAQAMLGKYLVTGKSKKDIWKKESNFAEFITSKFKTNFLQDGHSIIWKDIDEGIKWLTKAAERNNIEALSELGMFYCKDDSARDIEKSIYWLTKAAELGGVQEKYNLAKRFAYGMGLKKDSLKAKYWMQEAAKNGSKAAIEWLKENP